VTEMWLVSNKAIQTWAVIQKNKKKKCRFWGLCSRKTKL